MNNPPQFTPMNKYLSGEIRKVLISLKLDESLKVYEVQPKVEVPAAESHGDYSTNIAMVLSRKINKNPLEFAEELKMLLLQSDLKYVNTIEVVKPGFINFYLNTDWLYELCEYVLASGTENVAKKDIGKNTKIQIEFVSANPTGPLHVGNGWWAAYGDSLARLLKRCGYNVVKEYYVNDTGGQIRVLGESILAAKNNLEAPENGYRGDYIDELAKDYRGPEDIYSAGKWAAELILENIKLTLLKMNVEFDSWYSQNYIEQGGATAETLEELSKLGLIYESDGATYLASEKLGDSRDRVLIKSNGDITYTFGDIAYHRDKFLKRKFDKVIDVFGADHHGQVATLKAAVKAFGIYETKLEIQIGQMISLVGAKMSKRSGNFVKLEDFLNEVGVDATRLMPLMNSIDQATVLDIDLVKSTSMENPVYYMQYAYARICSIEKRAKLLKDVISCKDEINFHLLSNYREISLLKVISEFEDVVLDAADSRKPHKITAWTKQLASSFHSFYHDCKVLDESEIELTRARLSLVKATKITLAVSLEILGVTLPEHM